MSKNTFQFAVLRYIHDPVTEEFINIGVVLFSREAPYLGASISSRYSRLSKTFQEINGEHYRRIVNHIELRIAGLQNQLEQSRFFDDLPSQLGPLLETILPPDDSSFVFDGYGGGLTDDLAAEQARLYGRLVEQYTEHEDRPSRTDGDVWQTYRQELDKYYISQHLHSVTVRTPTYEYEFERAWRNERWHPIEPVSLDLMYESSILEKANRWIGRTAMLADSNEIGTLYMLLGSPRQDNLRVAYEKAKQNLRAKAPESLGLKLIEENEAAEFSEQLRRLIEEYNGNT